MNEGRNEERKEGKKEGRDGGKEGGKERGREGGREEGIVFECFKITLTAPLSTREHKRQTSAQGADESYPIKSQLNLPFRCTA